MDNIGRKISIIFISILFFALMTGCTVLTNTDEKMTIEVVETATPIILITETSTPVPTTLPTATPTLVPTQAPQENLIGLWGGIYVTSRGEKIAQTAEFLQSGTFISNMPNDLHYVSDGFVAEYEILDESRVLIKPDSDLYSGTVLEYDIEGDQLSLIAEDGEVSVYTRNKTLDDINLELEEQREEQAAERPFKTPTPWVACEGTKPTRLYLDGAAYVSMDPPLANRVRDGAGKDHKVIGQIEPGDMMKILEGPACADGWVWWRVFAPKTELTGWTAEGDGNEYWLIPCPPRAGCGVP
jgi:hypothetical protein